MTGEKPLKVLHVDDEKNQLEFTKLFLEQIDKDVEIDSVTNPEEALQKQEEENYDCIVSDYKMMKMNGIELAQKVREKSDVPFILYTGQGSEEVAELAFTAGVDDYLRKETEPTHYQVLAKRIKHNVEKHRAEELYRKVVEESRDAILIIVNNKVVFFNTAACNMMGIENLNECLGKEVHEFFVDENKIFPQKNSGEEKYVVKINYRTRSGSQKKAEVSISQINYRGEEAFLCFIRDITERNRNEERLEAIYKQATLLSSALSIQEISETTLDIIESVFNHRTTTFHLVEGDNIVTMATRDAPLIELTIPLKSNEIIAKAARDGQDVLVSDVSTCSDFMMRTTESKSVLAVPAVLNGKTVAVLNVESSKSHDFNEADKKLLETIAYHVAFAFNRIHTHTLEQREEEEKQERLNYALGVLDNAEKATSLIRQGLQRNILSILNAAGILRINPEMLPKLVDSIDEHADEAQIVSEIIEETINQSTLIKGFIEINQKMRIILEKYPFPKNIRVKTQYYEGILFVEADDDKFTRILNNLLSNAVEAMSGGGSLSAKVTTKEDQVFIDIGDTGSGIPESVMGILFKPFSSTKKGHSGLGLAFCKNAAESMGGSLSIRSSSSDGTTFRLTLQLLDLNRKKKF